MTEETSPLISIVIAVGRVNSYLRECLEHCARLEYPRLEVIVVPDTEPTETGTEVPLTLATAAAELRVIPSGPVGPGEKRDLGAKAARGTILAFLDDDTYPAPGYLRAAAEIFEDPGVGAACGPAVTPPDDDLLQQSSGWVYASPISGGNYTYRYLPQAAREVDDYPSCNLLVRRDAFFEAGGFDTRYWPGEDTILSLKLTHELGLRMVYHPSILVYHHRRRLFLPHLRQVWNYAKHRGFFAKRFPATSLRVSYFLPSLFLLYVISGGLATLGMPALWPVYVGSLLVYLTAVAVGAAWSRKLRLFPTVFAGIILTHVFYGAFFIRGLMARDLPR